MEQRLTQGWDNAVLALPRCKGGGTLAAAHSCTLMPERSGPRHNP